MTYIIIWYIKNRSDRQHILIEDYASMFDNHTNRLTHLVSYSIRLNYYTKLRRQEPTSNDPRQKLIRKLVYLGVGTEIN